MTKSILLVGVGGQGTILASKLLVTAFMQAGYDVKMSEIHGMAQRGGSVSSQVKYGDHVISPVIEIGGADIIVAFEKMEAARYLEFLRPDGQIIVNDYQINSMPILNGVADYPENVIPKLQEVVKTTVIKAYDIAEELGNLKVMNVVLLGALARILDIKRIDWPQIIRENIKPRFVEINLQAFERGNRLTD